MSNPKVQKLLHEKLESLVEPSLHALADGLSATKRRAIPIKGEIRYTDPEPNHPVRTGTANKILDRYERTSGGHATNSPVVPAHEVGQAPQEEVVDEAASQGGADRGVEVTQLDPADRNLIRRACDIDEKLVEIEQELKENKDGPEQPSEN